MSTLIAKIGIDWRQSISDAKAFTGALRSEFQAFQNTAGTFKPKFDVSGAAGVGKQIGDAIKQGVDNAKQSLSEIADAWDSEQLALKTALDQNLKATAAMLREGKKGSEEWDKHIADLKAAKKAADEYDQALAEVGKEIGDMPDEIPAPKTPPKGGGGGGQGTSFSQVALGAVAVTAVVDQAAQAFNNLAAPSKNLDYVTGQLRTLGTEAADMSESLKTSAIEMSKDLPFAASEIQQTMFDALASGVKGGEEGLKVFADTAAKLAVGGGAEIGEATGLLAGQLNAYGASSAEATKYADTFFNIVNFGVTSVKELSSTLSNVVPTAAAAGVSMDNVGAAYALMTQKGIGGAQASTKLNQLLIELQKPSATLAPILKAAGISLESLRNDSLPVSLGKVKKAIDDTGGAAIQFFSSSEAAAAFSVLGGDLEGFEQTLQDVATTSGSAQNAFDEMAKTSQVQTDIMKSKMDAFMIGVMDKLGPKFQAISGAAAEMAPVATSLGALSTLGVNAAKGIGSISEKISAAGGWSGVFSKMGDGMKSFGSSVMSGGKNVLSSLMSWKGAALGVAGVLVALIAGTEEGQAAMKEVQEVLSEAIGALMAEIGPVISQLMNAFQPLITALADLLGDVLGTLMATVVDIITPIANAIIPLFKMLGEALMPILQSVLSIIMPIVKSVSELIYGAFSAVADAIGGITNTLAPVFTNIFATLKPVFETLTATLTPVFEQLSGTLGEVLQTVGKIFADLVATMAPVITQIVGAITPVITVLSTVFTDVVGVILTNIGSLLTVLAPILGDIAKMIGGVLGDTLTSLAPLLTQLGTTIGDTLKTVGTLVGDIFKSIADTVIPIIKQLFETIVPIIQQLFQQLQPVIQVIIGTLSGVLQTLLGAIGPVLATLGEALKTIVGALGGALKSIFDALAPVMEKVGGVLTQIFGTIGTVIQTLVGALQPVFEKLAGVIQIIAPIIGNLVSTLVGALAPVVEKLAGVFGILLQTLAELLGTVLSALAPILEVVAQLFGDILGVVAGVIQELFAGLAPVLNEIIGVLGELVGTVGQTFADLLIELMPTVQLLTGLLAQLVSWIGDKLKDAMTAIMPILTAVIRALATGLTKAITVVVKVISAVLKVVSDLASAIGKWLVGAVKTATEWIKGAFQKAIEVVGGWIDWFRGLFQKVVNVISSVISWIGGFIKSLREAVPIIDWFGGIIETIIGFLGDLVGWIKDAVVTFLEWLGILDDAPKKVEIEVAVTRTGDAEMIPAEGKALPDTKPKPTTGGGGGGAGKDEKKDETDPYQKELTAEEKANEVRINLLKQRKIKEGLTEDQFRTLELENEELFQKNKLGIAQKYQGLAAADSKATQERKDELAANALTFETEAMEAAAALKEHLAELELKRIEELRKKREDEIKAEIEDLKRRVEMNKLTLESITLETEEAEAERLKIRKDSLAAEEEMALLQAQMEGRNLEEMLKIIQVYDQKKRDLERDSALYVMDLKIKAAKEAAENELNLTQVLIDGIGNLINNFYVQKDEQRQEDLQKEKDKLDEEQKDLMEALKERAITLQEYDNKVTEIEDRRRKMAETKNEITWKTIGEQIKEGGKNATKALAEDRSKILESSQNDYAAKLDNMEVRELELKRDYMAAGLEEEKAAAQASLESQAEANDARNELLGQAAVASTALFLQMVADGENAVKAMAIAVLDTALKVAPALIFEATLKTLASVPFPLNLAAAAAVTATATTLLAGLRSAAKNLRHGAVDIEGPGTETSDSIPAYLSRRETVLKAEATKAEHNAPLFEWLNETGRSFLEYPELPQLMGANAWQPQMLEFQDVSVTLSPHEENREMIGAIAEQTAALLAKGEQQRFEQEWMRREFTGMSHALEKLLTKKASGGSLRELMEKLA